MTFHWIRDHNPLEVGTAICRIEACTWRYHQRLLEAVWKRLTSGHIRSQTKYVCWWNNRGRRQLGICQGIQVEHSIFDEARFELHSSVTELEEEKDHLQIDNMETHVKQQLNKEDTKSIIIGMSWNKYGDYLERNSCNVIPKQPRQRYYHTSVSLWHNLIGVTILTTW